MSKAPVINFYPTNDVVTASELNVNWTGVQAATADINADNVRWESIDIRQLDENPVPSGRYKSAPDFPYIPT